MIGREPHIHPVEIETLRPTQITVGMREVEMKRKRWREIAKGKADFMESHMIPVIRGPRDHYYVIDHHHLALALHKEKLKKVEVTVVANLHILDLDAFWIYLDNRGWMHPFDRDGKRVDYEHIPKKLTELIDDPHRSLAGELRRVGGFAKDVTPFSEFLWADFLRRRIKRNVIESDFSMAMEQALLLARCADSDYLPGWCGAESGLSQSAWWT